jgi:thiosulfate reductase/polysulfide reductase chain A
MGDDNHSIRISRRALLKGAGVATGAAVGAAVAAAPSEAQAFRLLDPKQGQPADRVVPSFCEICFWKCGLHAHVRGNRVMHVTGHPHYPNAKGKLCGRGNAGPSFLSDPDRLKYPMVRVGKRGEGRFERVGWKTAYERIAQGFAKIKAQHGPEALAAFYHGTSGTMLRNMMAAFGTPNYAAPAYAQCKGPRDVGFKLTFGVPMTSPEPLDFEHTQCMVLFGSHLGENAHNGQVQAFVQARARGAKLVVLDPRLSTVASKADVWLPVAPGSDTAVILAWTRLLIEEGAYDRVFVQNHCVGFDELKKHVASATPQWAAKHAGVPAADIVRAYRLIAQSKPAVIVHPGRHVAWYGEQDTQRARAQAALAALLGSFWAKGGIFRPAAPKLGDWPTPNYPDFPKNVDQAAERYPFAKECTTNGIRDATRLGMPYPIKGWLVHGSNLMQSLPNKHHTVEAIERLDFLAVIDVLPTEITDWADVLLPEDMYLERTDDLSVGRCRDKPYVGLRVQAVKSPHDTRPGWRIAKELGTALGVGDFFAYGDFDEYLKARLKGTGVSLEQLKKDGVAFPKTKIAPYLDKTADYHWHTPSGKVELFSQRLADKGFAPLPTFREQPAPPKGWLRLLYGRSPLHTFGRTQNNSILNDLDPGNCVWLNPACAKAMGIAHGEKVMVENPHGDKTGPMPANVTERMPTRSLYMIHGFGNKSKKLKLAYGKGGSDTEVIDTYAVDPISGATGMRVQWVRVRKATKDEELYPCAMG